MKAFERVQEIREREVTSKSRDNMELMKKVFEVEKKHEKLEKQLRGAFCEAKDRVERFESIKPAEFVPVSERLTHAETWLLLLLVGLVILAIVHTGQFRDNLGRTIECSPIMHYLYFRNMTEKTETMKSELQQSFAFVVLLPSAIAVVLVSILIFGARRSDVKQTV